MAGSFDYTLPRYVLRLATGARTNKNKNQIWQYPAAAKKHVGSSMNCCQSWEASTLCNTLQHFATCRNTSVAESLRHLHYIRSSNQEAQLTQRKLSTAVNTELDALRKTTQAIDGVDEWWTWSQAKPSEAKQFKENLQNIHGNPHSPTGLHIATRTAGTAFRKAKQAGIWWHGCSARPSILQNGHSFQSVFTLPFNRL